MSISSPSRGEGGTDFRGPNAIVRLLDRCQRGDVAGSAMGPPPRLETGSDDGRHEREREGKQANTTFGRFSELEYYDSRVAVFFFLSAMARIYTPAKIKRRSLPLRCCNNVSNVYLTGPQGLCLGGW